MAGSAGPQVTEVKRFIHDCSACRFLGQFGKFDLYVCGKSGSLGQSVVARYGDEGPDYMSAPTEVVKQYPTESVLMRALEAAQARA
jgi:hypothetical protein